MSMELGVREIVGAKGTYTVLNGLGKGMQGRVKAGIHKETGTVCSHEMPFNAFSSSPLQLLTTSPCVIHDKYRCISEFAER